MKNIVIAFIMLLVPSLTMAQGPITRPGKTTTSQQQEPKPATHKHSVNGPNSCKKCASLRRQKEQQRRERQRLAEERRREEELRLAEERRRKAEEEARLAEQKRKEEEQRLAEERKRREESHRLIGTTGNSVIDNLINNMVYVDGGTFTMGATYEQGSDAWDDEKPTHRVTLSSFYIGKYEVTQAEWKAVMGNNPSYFKGDNLPVESVSWDDCQTFIRKLNALTGKTFRLPTEAEWEFAARGGNHSRGCKYSGSDYIGSVAWYDGNSGSKTHPIGQKSPNELGLYDMSGNVWEWCQDWYGSYSSSSQTNPTGAFSGSYRVRRGGSWCSYARCSRVSFRHSYTPGLSNYDLGLRLVL